MTLDTETYAPKTNLSDVKAFENDVLSTKKARHSFETAKNEMETRYDYCEDTEISDWENEGGANFDSPNSFLRDSGVEAVSHLTEHVDAAEALMADENYHAAYLELEAAANRLMIDRQKIEKLLDASIRQLTMTQCSTTPPHPKALPMVKLRQQISL